MRYTLPPLNFVIGFIVSQISMDGHGLADGLPLLQSSALSSTRSKAENRDGFSCGAVYRGAGLVSPNPY